MVIKGPLSEKNAKPGTEVELSSDDDERKPRFVYRHEEGTVELHLASLECLESETSYLKDNIIEFYINYLLHTICDKKTKSRVRIFDNYFSTHLSKVFSSGKVDGTRFQQVRKWYEGVDLFEKDFIVFPICSQEHWFAIVACYPRNVADFPPGGPKTDAGHESPGILVLDSMRLKAASHTERVRDFLDFEWRTRCSSVKRFWHKDLPVFWPNLPKQKNASDCGLYMLAYIECLLQNPNLFYRAAREDEKNKELRLIFDSVLKKNTRSMLRSTIRKVCEHI